MVSFAAVILAGVVETAIQDELSDQGVTSVKGVRIKDQGQEKDTNTFSFDLLQLQSAKGYPHRILASEGRPLCPQSIMFLQLPKVWTWSPKMQLGVSVP